MHDELTDLEWLPAGTMLTQHRRGGMPLPETACDSDPVSELAPGFTS